MSYKKVYTKYPTYAVKYMQVLIICRRLTDSMYNLTTFDFTSAVINPPETLAGGELQRIQTPRAA